MNLSDIINPRLKKKQQGTCSQNSECLRRASPSDFPFGSLGFGKCLLCLLIWISLSPCCLSLSHLSRPKKGKNILKGLNISWARPSYNAPRTLWIPFLCVCLWFHLSWFPGTGQLLVPLVQCWRPWQPLPSEGQRTTSAVTPLVQGRKCLSPFSGKLFSW